MSVYRVGNKLGTTIYRDEETQPCGWFPEQPGLAEQVVNLLNSVDELATLRAQLAEVTRERDQAERQNAVLNEENHVVHRKNSALIAANTDLGQRIRVLTEALRSVAREFRNALEFIRAVRGMGAIEVETPKTFNATLQLAWDALVDTESRIAALDSAPTPEAKPHPDTERLDWLESHSMIAPITCRFGGTPTEDRKALRIVWTRYGSDEFSSLREAIDSARANRPDIVANYAARCGQTVDKLMTELKALPMEEDDHSS